MTRLASLHIPRDNSVHIGKEPGSARHCHLVTSMLSAITVHDEQEAWPRNLCAIQRYSGAVATGRYTGTGKHNLNL